MLRAAILSISIFLVGFTTNGLCQNNDLKLKTIVIDAGHGGKDPGTLIGKLKEKDIVLDVALKTGKLIKDHYPEVNVIYTRQTDIFVPLKKRAEIANKAKADLFISIHVNYCEAQSPNGAETYILGNHRSEDNLKVAQMENSVILLEDDYSTKYEGFDPNSAESYIMFELIQNEYLEQSRMFANQVQTKFTTIAKRKNRGVRQAGFLVLRETVMPSVLVELGFISNANDNKYLQSKNSRNELATSIYQAFVNYKTRIDERSQITTSNKTQINKEPKAPIGVIEEKTQIISLEEKIKTGNWYAIQIAANSSPLSRNTPLFKSVNNIIEIQENGWYKYYTGFTQDYNKALTNRKELNQKFKGAFPVIFENGKKGKFKQL